VNCFILFEEYHSKGLTPGSEHATFSNHIESQSLAVRNTQGNLGAPNLSKGVQRLLSTLAFEHKLLDPKKGAEVWRRPKNKRLKRFFDDRG